MPETMELSAGLRMVSDVAMAAGGHWTNDTLALPASVGTGFIEHIAPEPGLMLAIHRYSLAQSSGKSVCRRKATAMASSPAESTVDAGTGPIGASWTVARLRHLATVFGLIR